MHKLAKVNMKNDFNIKSHLDLAIESRKDKKLVKIFAENWRNSRVSANIVFNEDGEKLVVFNAIYSAFFDFLNNYLDDYFFDEELINGINEFCSIYAKMCGLLVKNTVVEQSKKDEIAPSKRMISIVHKDIVVSSNNNIEMLILKGDAGESDSDESFNIYISHMNSMTKIIKENSKLKYVVDKITSNFRESFLTEQDPEEERSNFGLFVFCYKNTPPMDYRSITRWFSSNKTDSLISDSIKKIIKGFEEGDDKSKKVRYRSEKFDGLKIKMQNKLFLIDL